MAEVLYLLKKDLQKVQDLLEDLEEASPRAIVKRRDLLMQLKEELQLHETLEEEFFYSDLKKDKQAKFFILKAEEEHELVDELLEKLEATDFTNEAWYARLMVLKDNILHHIKEEEYDIFPLAKVHADQAKL